jgi:hypothetical protein
VRLEDGSLEAVAYAHVWPLPEGLDEEPPATVACTILGAVDKPRGPAYNEARWAFGRASQANPVMRVTFTSEIQILDKTVIMVDIKLINGVDLSSEIREISKYKNYSFYVRLTETELAL